MWNVLEKNFQFHFHEKIWKKWLHVEVRVITTNGKSKLEILHALLKLF